MIPPPREPPYLTTFFLVPMLSSKKERDPVALESTVVECPVDSCTWSIEIFGRRDNGRDTTFYLKPRHVPPGLPESKQPWAVTRQQRAHLARHSRRVEQESREGRFVEQVRKRLASKRFKAEGSTAAELAASRRARKNELQRATYREDTRLLHLDRERGWKVSSNAFSPRLACARRPSLLVC